MCVEQDRSKKYYSISSWITRKCSELTPKKHKNGILDLNISLVYTVLYKYLDIHTFLLCGLCAPGHCIWKETMTIRLLLTFIWSKRVCCVLGWTAVLLLCSWTVQKLGDHECYNQCEQYRCECSPTPLVSVSLQIQCTKAQSQNNRKSFTVHCSVINDEMRRCSIWYIYIYIYFIYFWEKYGEH